jgi:hypothetical protein
MEKVSTQHDPFLKKNQKTFAQLGALAATVPTPPVNRRLFAAWSPGSFLFAKNKCLFFYLSNLIPL